MLSVSRPDDPVLKKELRSIPKKLKEAKKVKDSFLNSLKIGGNLLNLAYVCLVLYTRAIEDGQDPCQFITRIVTKIQEKTSNIDRVTVNITLALFLSDTWYDDPHSVVREALQ